MNLEHLLTMGEFTAAALYEEPDRSLFYRKALAIRRFYEHCALHPYRGTPLYPSGSVKANMSLVPNYLTGLSFPSSALRESEPEITERIGSEFFARYSSVPAEHCVAGNMYTHSMPHYERVLKEGLLSYAERIEKIADRDMREGLLHLIEGIKIYVNRCAEYLRSAGAEEKLIRALEKAPLYGAENIYEAVLAWNFVLYLDNCDNLGCLDRGLLPYFRGEDITDLLENLYSNLNDNGGYSMSLDSVCPALTCQCLRAARGCRRPMIEMLIDENTPEEVWNEALETVRTGGGQPAFYNKTLLFDDGEVGQREYRVES